MSIEGLAGVSLPLWTPDEGILADNINLRERRYGGIYFQDNFGASTGVPVINFSSSGSLYGAPVYGYETYAALLGVSLMISPLTFGEISPTVTLIAPANNVYNGGSYGFIGYLETQEFIQDPLSISDPLSPIILISNTGSFYGNSDTYGLIPYGANLSLLSGNLTFSEPTPPTLTVCPLNTFVYGNGTKYGFGVWQA